MPGPSGSAWGRRPKTTKTKSASFGHFPKMLHFRPGASQVAQIHRLRVTAKVRPERGQGYALTRIGHPLVGHLSAHNWPS
jgi:hypothetical protein